MKKQIKTSTGQSPHLVISGFARLVNPAAPGEGSTSAQLVLTGLAPLAVRRIGLRSALAIAQVACLALPSAAQGTTLVSVAVGGAPTDYHSDLQSANPPISADGRFVAYWSLATNIVAGDTNGKYDIFVRDLQNNTTERVSVATGGGQSSDDSRAPSISADGRFVAFASNATNLVPGTTYVDSRIFIRDRLNGTTELVSMSFGGGLPDNGSGSPSISADGRFVAFESLAHNLVVGGDTNLLWDVFIRDRQNATTELASVNSGGVQANDSCGACVISADGRFVAFNGRATNLVVGDTNGSWDTFVHDRLGGTTIRVSVDSSGVEGDYGSDSHTPCISADGRYVGFLSFSTNLVPGDTNGAPDSFVRDIQNGTTERVSVATGGVQGGGVAFVPSSISADGRFAAFTSGAADLVPGDTNASWDIFVHDRQNGTTERVSVTSSGGESNGQSLYQCISANGRFVAFDSWASNLVAGDANGWRDVFLRDRGLPPPVSYCFGDTSGTACPCSNHSAPGASQGCLNSFGVGATISATGNPSLASDSVVLTAGNLPAASVLFFQGTTRVNGGLGVAFGDGLRCAGGTIIRLHTHAAVGSPGTATSFYPDTSHGDLSVSVRGLVTSAGTRTYQAWYRNAAAFCTASVFNLSNGIELAWTP